MLSQLPSELVFNVKNQSSGELPLPDVVVSMELYWRGLYYYGDLIGITDADGTARIARDRLLQDFAKDQHLFPMDFKVPLEQSDAVIGIVVRGESDFLAVREAINKNPLVTFFARDVYARGRNASLQTTRRKIELPATATASLSIDLAVSTKVS
jgi:hypothetical protein